MCLLNLAAESQKRLISWNTPEQSNTLIRIHINTVLYIECLLQLVNYPPLVHFHEIVLRFVDFDHQKTGVLSVLMHVSCTVCEKCGLFGKALPWSYRRFNYNWGFPDYRKECARGFLVFDDGDFIIRSHHIFPSCVHNNAFSADKSLVVTYGLERWWMVNFCITFWYLIFWVPGDDDVCALFLFLKSNRTKSLICFHDIGVMFSWSSANEKCHGCCVFFVWWSFVYINNISKSFFHHISLNTCK